MRNDNSLHLTDKEIASAFADEHWAQRFPPILDLDLASELSHIPKGTLYGWSARGALGTCARKVGKHLLIYRDRFIKMLFNEDFLHA